MVIAITISQVLGWKEYFHTVKARGHRRGLFNSHKQKRFDFALSEIEEDGVRIFCIQSSSHFYFAALHPQKDFILTIASDAKGICVGGRSRFKNQGHLGSEL